MLEEKAYQIRRLALEIITYGQVGHPGGSPSEAGILACRYFSELRLDPAHPQWPERDRFVMSKAHGCPGQYAALALQGFFPQEEIYTYGAIVTTENHGITGGLGSAVAEVLVEGRPVPMERIAVRDRFVECGEVPDLFAKYQVRPEDIAAAARRAIGHKR